MRLSFYRARHTILLHVLMIFFDTYRMLPQEMQAELLFRYGVYREPIRKKNQLNIELYALDSFYVELYFDKQTEAPFFKSI